MKFGTFALYKGKEFEVTRLEDESFKLISRGNAEAALGFGETKFPGIYTRIVKRNELETAYIIKTCAIYQGYTFEVLEEKDNQMLITTSDSSIGEKLNMDTVDRWDYRKWIKIAELDRVWEDKKPVYEFK